MQNTKTHVVCIRFGVSRSLVGVWWSVLAALRAANTDHQTPTND